METHIAIVFAVSCSIGGRFGMALWSMRYIK